MSTYQAQVEMKKYFPLLIFFLVSLFSYSQVTQNEDFVYLNLAKKLYDEAAKAQSLNNFSGAILSLDKAISLNPSFEAAYIKRGEIKLATNDIKGAIDDFTKSLQLAPNQDAYVLRAQAYLLNSNIDESYNDLVKTLSPADFSKPDDQKKQLIGELSQKLFEKGMTDFKQGKKEAAIGRLNQILILDPQNPYAYFKRGMIYYENGDYSSAIINYDRTIDLQPSVETYFYRGASRLKMNNHEGAFEDIWRALAGKKNLGIEGSEKIIANLAQKLLDEGVIERKKGNLAAASNYLQQSITLQPNVSQAYFEKGLIEFKKNEFAAAIENFNKSFNLTASDETKFYRGCSYIETNDLNSAFNDLKIFINSKVEFIENNEVARILEKLAAALSTDALVLERQGRDEQAIETYSKVLQINAYDINAIRNRANLYIRQNNLTGAINDLTQLIQLQPSNEAYFLRGKCHLQQNNIDAAVADLVKTINAEGGWDAISNSEKVYQQLSVILFEQGVSLYKKADYTNAKDKFSLVQLINPAHNEVFLYQGLINFKNKDYRRAISDFDRILALQPSNEAFLYRAKSKIALKDLDGAFSDLGKITSSELDKNLENDYQIAIGELADNFYEEALGFQEKGSYRQAQQRFEQVINLKPNFPKAHYYIGLNLFNQKKYLEAITRFDKAIELKSSKEAYFYRGTAKSEINDLSGAFDDLLKAKSLQPDNSTDVNLSPSATNNPIKKPTRPAQRVQNVVVKDSKSYSASIIKADGFFEDKKYNEAIAAYSEASLFDPTQSYPKDKIREATQLLVAEPVSSNSYEKTIAFADDLFSRGDFENAKLNYEIAIGINPASTYPQKMLETIGTIEAKSAENNTPTNENQEKNIDELPGKETSANGEVMNESTKLYNEGLELYYENNLDSALVKFEEATKLDPKFTDAFYNSGFIKLNQEKYEEANDDFDRVIQLIPSDKAYFYKGRGMLGLNDLEGALIQFSMAIEMNPQFFYAFNNRGNVRFQLGDFLGAIEDFDKTININPEFVFAYNNRGNARFKTNDYTGAIADYDKAIQMRPEYGFAYLNRGIAKEILGDVEGACADWKKAADAGIEVGKVYFEEQCEKKE